MKIAIEGCCHGELDDIYGTIKLLEQREDSKIDLVLICGDFQAVRNTNDLESMSVPIKYRHLGTFWKYYAGLVKAPYPTVFIGGNHEASNHLWELYHGGWVCENIYYLGHAGVINFNGIRIGGLSGIYNQGHYDKGHYETIPYNSNHIRSVYHVREYEVQKLLQIRSHLDIFLSHDWPRGVERFGDLNSLLSVKKYFYQEVLNNTLGSPPNELLLKHLKPEYWFAAHLHVKYAAYVDHDKYEKEIYSTMVNSILNISSNTSTLTTNPDEIIIDDDDEENNNNTINTNEKITNPDEILITDNDNDDQNDQKNNLINKENQDNIKEKEDDASTKITKFLGLDKCLPNRQFLQVIDIPQKNEDGFTFDLEWLAITKAMSPYLSLKHGSIPLPSNHKLQQMIEKEKEYIGNKLNVSNLKIPNNFEIVAPTHDPNVPRLPKETLIQYQKPISNPQTQSFCDLIDIENKISNIVQTNRNDNNDDNLSSSPSKKLKIDE